MSSNSKHYLHLTQNTNMSGKSKLSLTAKHASWGSFGDGLHAQIYIKTGSGWAWHSGKAAKLTSTDGTTLSINLASVANLNDVREIGVEFFCLANSSGQTSVYIDNVTLQ